MKPLRGDTSGIILQEEEFERLTAVSKIDSESQETGTACGASCCRFQFIFLATQGGIINTYVVLSLSTVRLLLGINYFAQEEITIKKKFVKHL